MFATCIYVSIQQSIGDGHLSYSQKVNTYLPNYLFYRFQTYLSRIKNEC